LKEENAKNIMERDQNEKKFICADFEVKLCASNFHCYSIELLRCLNKSALHDILKSPFSKLLKEDLLLKMLVKLGSDSKESLSHIEAVGLTSDGLSLFLDSIDCDDLSEVIWHQIVAPLRSEIRTDLR
jgi:hypothetical protein